MDGGAPDGEAEAQSPEPYVLTGVLQMLLRVGAVTGLERARMSAPRG